VYTQTSSQIIRRLRRALRGWIRAGAWAGLCATVATPAVAQKTEPAKTQARARNSAVRTLEAITIEGEIAVPQVLFITSRDYRRFRDGLGATYRATALDVARAIDQPTRLRVVPMTADNKEDGE